MKKIDPNQIDLFAAFGIEVEQKIIKKEKRIEPVFTHSGETKTDSEMELWFATKCKQSLAFLNAVLSGKLPGDFHGTKLWMRRWKDLWTNEPVENADYWIDRGYRIIEQKETVCIIKI